MKKQILVAIACLVVAFAFAQKKELKVISNLEELKSNHQDNNTIDVQIHDSYFVFDNSDEADRFIHSMPDFLQSSVKIYRKND